MNPSSKRVARRSSSWLNSCCTALFLQVALSCAAAPVEVRPATVVTHREPDKPELGLVERDGDPQAAIGVAVFTRAPARTNARLARAAAKHLTNAGYEPVARSADNALLVAVLLPTAAAAHAATEQLRRALLLAPLGRQSGGELYPDDGCGFATEPLSPEHTREEIGQRTTRIVVVGSREWLDLAVEGYQAAPAWPEGARLEDPWPDKHRFDWVPTASDHFGATQALQLALRTTDSGRALAAQKELAADDGTLAALARAEHPPWEIARVHSTLRPSGACLSVELWSPEPEPASPGRTARLFAEEIAHQLRTSAVNPGPLRAVSSADPREAALSAAWAALADPDYQEEARWLVRFHAAHQQKDLAKDFAGPLSPPIVLRHRAEAGQGRIWAMLTSPCPTDHEEAAQAGHTFAALASTALSPHARKLSVDLEPWVRGSRLGLVASAPSGPAAAEAVGEGLGMALLTAGHDEVAIAATRQRVLAAQPASRGWAVTLSLLSGDAPSRLAPSGLGSSLQGFSGPGAERAVQGLLTRPLELVVSGNATEVQARALRERVSKLLAPIRHTEIPCQTPTVPGAANLQLDVGPTERALPSQETPLQSPVTQATDLVQAWVGFATPAEAWAVTHWTAELLNGPTGWLSKAVLSADALQSAEALAFAAPGRSGALVIALESPASSLEAAIAQTRALLVRLGEQPPKALNFSDAAARRGSLRELRDPRVRLAELAWPRPPAPDSAALGKLLREHFGADKAIVVRSAEPRPAAE